MSDVRHPLLFAFLVAMLLSGCGTVSAQTALYRLPPQGAAAMTQLAACGLDVQSVREGCDLYLHSPEELALVLSHGFRPQLLQADVQAYYASRLTQYQNDTPSPPFGQGSMGGYFTLDEVVAYMDGLQVQAPNLIAAKVQIGTSLQGRPLWMWKLSDNPGIDESEPEVLLDALHHAREPISMQCLLWFATELVSGYGTSAAVTELVNGRELFLVPVVNPDGYVHNQTTNPSGGGLWRKNRRSNADGSYGVDLNRNYSFAWGSDNFGSSPTPSQETYRGTAPFSEPESAALAAFAQAHALDVYISLHTYGQQWFVPPDWTGNQPLAPARTAVYAAHADALGALLPLHDVAHVWTWLYPSNGTSSDWMESALVGGGHCLAFASELGTSVDGFWPATSRITTLSAEGAQFLFELVSRAGLRIAADEPVIEPVLAGAPQAWEPGESASVLVAPKNVGALAGAVTATISGASPGLEILVGSSVSPVLLPMSGAQPLATPLVVRIASSVAPGTVVSFSVVLSGPDAVTTHHTLTRMVGTAPLSPFSDDFEIGGAWTVGALGDNASGGVWVQADPNATSFVSETCNPEDDHSAIGTLCFVTGNGAPGVSAGSADLDGTSTLVSPVFDLSHTQQPVISWWRWFATFGRGNDTLKTEISNDGGATWRLVELINNHQNSWVRKSLRVEDILPRTNAMRLRFRASDPDSMSICEAVIDDVRVDSEAAALDLAQVTSAQPGSACAFALAAPFFAGDPYVAGCAFTATIGASTPLGRVGLDVDALFWLVYSEPAVFSNFVGQFSATGNAAPVINVPPLPSLTGLNFCCAAVATENGALTAVSGTARIQIQ